MTSSNFMIEPTVLTFILVAMKNLLMGEFNFGSKISNIFPTAKKYRHMEL